MGELQAARGCLLVRGGAAGFELRASRGLAARARPRERARADAARAEDASSRVGGRGRPALSTALGLDVLCPVAQGAARVIAVLGLGRARRRPRLRRGGGRVPAQRGRLRGHADRERPHLPASSSRSTSGSRVKVFQLHNLFDISRELTASLDEEAIKNLRDDDADGTPDGVALRALPARTGGGLVLAHERGLRRRGAAAPRAASGRAPVLEVLRGADGGGRAAAGPAPRRAPAARAWRWSCPLRLGGRARGPPGRRRARSGAPFTEEDRDFALTLARQALAALESVRLHRVRAREAAPGPRAADRARDPAEPVPARAAGDRRVRGGGAQPCPATRSAATTTTSSRCPAAAWPLAIADVSGKGTPGQHPDGVACTPRCARWPAPRTRPRCSWSA